MAGLFAVLAAGLALIAVAAARADAWVPAVGAAALAVWMLGLARAAAARRRRG